MMRHDVRDCAGALAYLTDCTMATVGSMACRKSRPKHEYLRQIEIAQCGYDWCCMFGVPIAHTRMRFLDEHEHSVKAWAATYEAETNPTPTKEEARK